MEPLPLVLPLQVYNDFYVANKFFLDDALVFFGENGSFAQNLNLPDSDHDYVGVVVPPPHFVLNYGKVRGVVVPWDNWRFKVEENGVEYEGIFYSCARYFQLLLSGNPNVVGLLWNRPKFNHVTEPFEEVIFNREVFSSNRSLKSFYHFAKSELAQMTEITAKTGAERRGVIAKYGYNLKSAVNAIRMLTMITEFAATGVMNVYRESNRDLLLQIKTGKWTVEQVREYAAEKFSELERVDSCLPEEPDEFTAQYYSTGIQLYVWKEMQKFP